ncbi:hypothetical protein [Allorhodopirellula solitaria]|uniref:Uncharacterized protein n=1 Tax=Allorhodopirellula solitaria TaxID=2527987 RepID=A0A5C5YKH1_9BACT|nr:hypothetical protein [Allorhodopirellula solitaria]TWT75413.1 hypothetical protein CA85_07040 [Allorhodopirellula solitaria]
MLDPLNQHHGDIENLIRDAGDYVRPGDQLRARILEQVDERRQRRRLWQRLVGGVVFTTTVAWLLLVVGQIGVQVAPHGRSASDLHEQASRRANIEGIGWEWALTEVIYDWRRRPGDSSTRQPNSQLEGTQR